mgnify:CR=1 FL=1
MTNPITPDTVRALIADTEPRAPLLSDGTMPLDSDGNCTACGWKTAAYVPDGPDHGAECPADREHWRLVSARAIIRNDAPKVALAYLAVVAERDRLARIIDNPGDYTVTFRKGEIPKDAHRYDSVSVAIPAADLRDHLRARLDADRAGGSDV